MGVGMSGTGKPIMVRTDKWESGPLGDDVTKEWSLVIDGVAFPEAIVSSAWSKSGGSGGRFHYEGSHPALGRSVIALDKPRSAKETAARLVRAMRQAGVIA